MASNPPGDCPGQAGARFRHRPCQGLRDVFCIVPAFLPVRRLLHLPDGRSVGHGDFRLPDAQL